MNESIRVLMVEDSPQDQKLILYALKRHGYVVESTRVQDAVQMRSALQNENWDVILCDYTMPQFSGDAALEILNQTGLDIPFILVSGRIIEEKALSMMKSGASDFIMKDNLGRLAAAVERELREASVRRQRRRAEAELASQRIIMDTVLNQAAEAILVCDQQGQIIFANPAALRLTRQSDLKSLQAETAWGIETGLDESPIPRQEWVIPRALRGEIMTACEVHMRRPDGSTYDVLINGAPLQDHDGSTIGAVSVLTDITALRRAEAQQRQYAADLERSNHELKQFTSIVSHDLKEPLRKVKGFSDLLSNCAQDCLSEEARGYIYRIVNATDRMEEMITGLLNYSYISTHKDPFSTVDLNLTASEVLSDLELLISQKQGKVELGSLPVIEADGLQMRQLLQNLISNALKFHLPNQPPQVRVWAETMGSGPEHQLMACLHVADDGIGFDEKYVQQIFQPFQRLHGRSEYEGTGIGLAICQKIVERHRGAIQASSIPGEGSTFTITLPVVQHHASEPEAPA